MARQFRLLTRPAIRALKPGDKITENGITASKLGDGDVRYSINVMVDGQRIHRVIGLENDGTTRTQAEEFITKVRSDAKAGRLQLPKGRKLPLTFTAAAANYLAGEREVDAKDIASKERHLRLHLVPYFGHMRVDGTGEDARTYSVSFDRILTELSGHYRPVWDLERGGRELHDLLTGAKFTHSDFRGGRCNRLTRINELRESGRVDESLRLVGG